MQLTRTHRILIGVVIAGALVIAAIGFAGSYAAVRDLAEDKGFGEFSKVFPIGIDAGIVVLLALDLLLTWIRIPFPLLRQTAWLLTAATIAFNGAAAWPDPLGVGMHAVIPVLFVVSVEAARHAIGRIADITADRHMESVRIARWLLAPVPTFRLWRRMKLWELRSYDEVIKLEQDRLVYRARLRARYGRAWKRKAPVESLMPLRLARYGVPLAETADAGLAAAGIEPPVIRPALTAGPAGGAGRGTEAGKTVHGPAAPVARGGADVAARSTAGVVAEAATGGTAGAGAAAGTGTSGPDTGAAAGELAEVTGGGGVPAVGDGNGAGPEPLAGTGRPVAGTGGPGAQALPLSAPLPVYQPADETVADGRTAAAHAPAGARTARDAAGSHAAYGPVGAQAHPVDAGPVNDGYGALAGAELVAVPSGSATPHDGSGTGGPGSGADGPALTVPSGPNRVRRLGGQGVSSHLPYAPGPWEGDPDAEPDGGTGGDAGGGTEHGDRPWHAGPPEAHRTGHGGREAVRTGPADSGAGAGAESGPGVAGQAASGAGAEGRAGADAGGPAGADAGGRAGADTGRVRGRGTAGGRAEDGTGAEWQAQGVHRLLDDMPVEEICYGAFRQHLADHNKYPSAFQFGRLLRQRYGLTEFDDDDVQRHLDECKQRHQAEREAEHP